MSLGVAALGSLGTALYRDDITVPRGVPAEEAEAVRGGMEGAVVAAQHLPAGLREQVLAAAREAYTSGLNVVGVVCASLVAVTAVLAVTLLRKVGGAAPQQPEPADAPQESVPAGS
ncbi:MULTISPECIES: hypothetical protein [unclassified Streptomyces]|uniref:hypothetical protein n=1 Tax=unclassified Streptomyces TaxID=2593676 RepID=UPI003D72F898